MAALVPRVLLLTRRLGRAPPPVAAPLVAASRRRPLFSQRGTLPLRRRSTDFSVYVVTTFVGIAGGCYIFLEPLRQLRLEQQQQQQEQPPASSS